jgi:aspartyl-tRNA(Asn)/glutamyl-tRNA(Gln) amidotransferase subunit A
VDDPIGMYLSDVLTLSRNRAGPPGMSVPCGLTDTGLPVGLPLMANHFAEETIFRVAYSYEQETPWHERKPMEMKP